MEEQGDGKMNAARDGDRYPIWITDRDRQIILYLWDHLCMTYNQFANMFFPNEKRARERFVRMTRDYHLIRRMRFINNGKVDIPLPESGPDMVLVAGKRALSLVCNVDTSTIGPLPTRASIVLRALRTNDIIYCWQRTDPDTDMVLEYELGGQAIARARRASSDPVWSDIRCDIDALLEFSGPGGSGHVSCFLQVIPEEVLTDSQIIATLEDHGRLVDRWHVRPEILKDWETPPSVVLHVTDSPQRAEFIRSCYRTAMPASSARLLHWCTPLSEVLYAQRLIDIPWYDANGVEHHLTEVLRE
jgi:hypothetical protein